jgi:hypothetical protein
MAGKLIFVYNADSGPLNTVVDTAHKIFSPGTYSCKLCALTHDFFSARHEWTEFIAGLGVECEFLHRDDLQRRLPGLEVSLPAILHEKAGATTLCLSAEAINRCNELAALKQAITEACSSSR